MTAPHLLTPCLCVQAALSQRLIAIAKQWRQRWLAQLLQALLVRQTPLPQVPAGICGINSISWLATPSQPDRHRWQP